MRKLNAIWALWKADRYILVIEKQNDSLEAHINCNTPIGFEIVEMVHKQNQKVVSIQAA